MDANNFEQMLKSLLDEFEKSNMSVDDFIKDKLAKSGRADADVCAKEIIETLTQIDEKYSALQKSNEAGQNREEWLREQIDDAAKNISAENTGKILSSAIKVINGESSDTPDENASFNALDAAIMVKNLDDALVKNVCNELENRGER